jgi:polysaccharide export outer membrane protein
MRNAIIPLLILALVTTGSYAAQKSSSQYKLQPTDVLTITVHGHPDLTTKTRVTSDGYISFPLLDKVSVAGITVQELEEKLKQLLEKDYLVKAEVLVFIEEYHPRQVSVIGEVNLPGKYSMSTEKDMTLLEAIAMGGGFTKDADINRVKVIRMEGGEKKTIDINVKDITERGLKDKDITLAPDDVVFVPKSFFFSITGEVKRAGKFNMPTERNITLLEAIAMAGGFTKDADINRTKIMRMEDGVKIMIPVKVKDITERNDKDKDVVLKSDDMIFVPKRSFFSVIGEVKNPGKFDMPAERDVTLLEAIAMAGGFTKDADITKTKIMRRTESGEKETITINVKDVTERNQKDKNIILEGEDMVIVPESFF